jgi:alkylation response protein AidB-like acyl-CoA dehydrogenase
VEAAVDRTLDEQVAAVAGMARERSEHHDRDGRVAPEVAAALAAGELLRLYVPRALGGREADPLTGFEVVEAMASADPATGWVTFVLNGGFAVCWLDPLVAKELLDAAPGQGMAGTFAPIGRATPEPGGAFRLEGRWPFTSGCHYAGTFMEGGHVLAEDGAPRRLADGSLDWRFFFVPAAEVEILDTWHVAGLKGTGSEDVAIHGARVPAERTVNPLLRHADRDEPHFRWPFFSLIGTLMVGVPLGIARRALDDVREVVATKTRRATTPIGQTDGVAQELARAEGALRAARALVVDAIGSAWDQALAGDRLGVDQRAGVRLATFHAAEAALEVVDTSFRLAGGHGLYEQSHIQRCWRDAHAARQHVFFCDSDLAETGRALLTGVADSWVV